MKISCGYTPPPVEPAPWEPTTLSPTAPKSRTVWAEVIGENRVRLSWDTDDLFAIVEGVPEGVVLPKKSVTSWGNNIQVVVAKGSVEFTMSNWPVAEFTAKACHHKSDCYNQGCADPNYQHKITDVCLSPEAARVDTDYSFTNAPPKVTLVSPSAATVQKGASVAVHVAVSEQNPFYVPNLSNVVDRVEIYVAQSAAKLTDDESKVATLTSLSDGLYKNSFAAAQSGAYYVLAVAYDTLGATGYALQVITAKEPEVAGGAVAPNTNPIELDRYQPYYGDFNDDGNRDVYFHGLPLIVLLHGDIVTPIVLPTPTGFAYFGNANGGFNDVEPWDMTKEALATCESSGTCAKVPKANQSRGDLDGDGHEDILIKSADGNSSTFVVSGTDGATLPQMLLEVLPSGQVRTPGKRASAVPVYPDNLHAAQISIGAGRFVVAGEGRAYSQLSSPDAVGAAVAKSEQIQSPAGSSLPSPTLSMADQATIDWMSGLSGEFRVNEMGASTYSVPLELPPGTAGVAPTISFDYSSQSGVGVMGLGWNLSVGGAISRCRQTLQVDKRALPIKFDSTDRFCLNGQRLLLVNDKAYGSDGAQYRTEVDSGVIVTSKGRKVGHPDYFELTAKDGSRSFYGHSGHSRRQGYDSESSTAPKADSVMSWHISQFEDSVLNKITYHYQASPTYHRLSEIKYAYGGSTDPAVVVSFNYGSKTFSRPEWVEGRRFEDNSLLTGVSVTDQERSFRDYVVEHNVGVYESGADLVDRVTQIQRCTGDYCASPLKITWGVSRKSQSLNVKYPSKINRYVSNPLATLGPLQAVKTDLGGSAFAYNTHLEMDINGDGLPDVVTLYINTFFDEEYYALKQSLQEVDSQLRLKFGAETPIANRMAGNVNARLGAEAPRLVPVDLNVDGRMDLAVYLPKVGEWKTYISAPQTNGSWRLESNATLPVGISDNLQFADLNSDGLTDLFYTTGTDLKVHYLRKKTPASANPTPEELRAINESPTAYEFSASADLSLTAANFDTYNFAGAADLDLDGKVDIVAAEISYTSHHTSWQSGPNIGHGSTEVRRTSTCNFDIDVAVASATGTDLSLTSYKLKEGSFSALEVSPGAFLLPRCDKADFRRRIIGPYLSDLDADGLSDLVWAFAEPKHLKGRTNTADPEYHFKSIQYRLGKKDRGFGEIKSDAFTVEALGFQLMDLNSDGYQDVILSLKDDARTRLTWSDGKFVAAGSLASAAVGRASRYSDMDGDGLMDYVRVQGDELAVRFGTPRQNDLVTVFTTGQGVKTVVQYEPLNQSGAYTKLGGISSSNTGPSVCKQYEYVYSGYAQPSSQCTRWGPSTVAEPSDFYAAINDPFSDEDPLSNIHATQNVPALEYISAMPVVTAVGSSSPVPDYPTALAVVSYEYEDLRVQAGGRGMLGFGRLSSNDVQTGVKTTTEYRQDWPFIGSPKRTVTVTASGQTLSESKTDMAIFGIDTNVDMTAARNTVKASGTGALGPITVYAKSAEDSTYWVSEQHLATNVEGTPAITDKLLTQVTTTTTVDEWNNVDVMVIDKKGWLGAAWVSLETQTTDNTYYNVHDGVRYGRLKTSEVTTERPSTGASQTKKAEFVYYDYGHSDCTSTGSNLRGLLCSEEIVELSSTDTKHSVAPEKVLHRYDDFGNKIFTIQGSRASALTAYDDLGRYPAATYDMFARASGETGASPGMGYSSADAVVVQTSEVLSRSVQGVPLLARQYIGNGNSVFQKQAVTPMGNPYFKGDSTGAYQQTTIRRSDGLSAASTNPTNCPAGTKHTVSIVKAGGAEGGECKDLVGRTVGTYKRGFNGGYIRTEQQYDILGRVVATSEPSLGSAPALFSYTAYDILGRPVHMTHPFKVTDDKGNEGGSYATTTLTYDGFTVSSVSSGVTGGADRTKVTEKNALGEVISVTEQGTRTVGYKYNVQGKLTEVKDTSGKVVQSVHYNGLGQKYEMFDVDKGTWKYHYDEYGDLVKQVDAKNQTTIIEYDFKGRKLVSRTYTGALSAAPAIHQTWDYDTAANGLGQLARERDLTERFTKQYNYDGLGRATVTTTMLPGKDDRLETFYQEQTYDSIGRSHQTFDAARVGPQFGYNGVLNIYNQYGYLSEVVDAARKSDGSRNRFYRVEAMDARGNVTKMLYGDGNEVRHAYDPNTGFLEEIIRTGVLPTSQTYTATWDHLGNLVKRQDDFYGDMPETFSYDEFNRLTSNTLGTKTVSLTYFDATDNIKSKSDQQDGAEYEYDPIQIHAVRKIGDRELTYDANGNAKTDGAKVLNYSAKDQVVDITHNGHITTFDYGSDGGRFKRVDTTRDGKKTTTLYIGSVEKVYNYDNTVVWKRNIGGIAQIEHAVGSNGALGDSTKKFFYKDHLGSLVAITNADGSINKRLAFDPWGARRDISGSTWQASNMSQSSILAAYAKDTKPITNRGFTGHEMLDEVGIIHMNGRIYDATLGRFLQADPFIQNPTSVGSLNRYSYLMNNPLNGVDPSGYFSLKRLWKDIKPFAGIIVGAILVVASGGTLAAPMGSWFFTNFGTAALLGGITGAVGAAANGGNIFKGALFGAVSGAAFFGVGEMFQGALSGLQGAGQFFAKTAAHGTVGGILSVLQEGKFGHGFIGAGVAKGFSLVAQSLDAGVVGEFMSATIAGGTVSELTGGKFSNGAQTAAIAYLANAAAHKGAEGAQSAFGGEVLSGDINDLPPEVRALLTDEEFLSAASGLQSRIRSHLQSANDPWGNAGGAIYFDGEDFSFGDISREAIFNGYKYGTTNKWASGFAGNNQTPITGARAILISNNKTVSTRIVRHNSDIFNNISKVTNAPVIVVARDRYPERVVLFHHSMKEPLVVGER